MMCSASWCLSVSYLRQYPYYPQIVAHAPPQSCMFVVPRSTSFSPFGTPQCHIIISPRATSVLFDFASPWIYSTLISFFCSQTKQARPLLNRASETSSSMLHFILGSPSALLAETPCLHLTQGVTSIFRKMLGNVKPFLSIFFTAAVWMRS